MTDTELPCQTCGALLTNARHEADHVGESVWYWHCENGHWWQQSATHGWTPIDPADVPAEPVMFVVEDA